MEALQIGADSITTGVTVAADIAIPVQSGGEPPRWVYLATDAPIGFKPVVTGETPAIAVMAILRPDNPLVVYVGGSDAIRAESPSGTANITVTPLDNQ